MKYLQGTKGFYPAPGKLLHPMDADPGIAGAAGG